MIWKPNKLIGNVGMTTTDENDPGSRSPDLVDILSKIGTVNYFESKEP